MIVCLVALTLSLLSHSPLTAFFQPSNFSPSSSSSLSFSPTILPPIAEQPETLAPRKTLNTQAIVKLGCQNILALFNLIGQCPETFCALDEITGQHVPITAPPCNFNPDDPSLKQSWVMDGDTFYPELKACLSSFPIKIEILPPMEFNLDIRKPDYKRIADQTWGMLALLPNGLTVPERAFESLFNKINKCAQEWPQGIIFLWEYCKNNTTCCAMNTTDADYIREELFKANLTYPNGSPLPFVASMLSACLKKIVYSKVDPTKCTAILNPEDPNKKTIVRQISPIPFPTVPCV